MIRTPKSGHFRVHFLGYGSIVVAFSAHFGVKFDAFFSCDIIYPCKIFCVTSQ